VSIVAEQRTYVAGRWITGDDVVSVENPADESHVAEITATPLAEVQRAIAEAERSTSTPPSSPPTHPAGATSRAG
jgi:acyl-CoA reductase-like NAD-dependent aldehyde dehydrogenase